MNIEYRLQKLNDRINEASIRYGRDPADVHLLAVSKTKPVAMIKSAFSAGQRHFGENYLQDALTKIPQIEACWHFIGAIQSNKTRLVAEYFDWVHTVASEKVARRLSAQRPQHRPALNVLLQVNTSGEQSKAGVTIEELPSLLNAVAGFDRLNICGLMTIPEQSAQVQTQRKAFRELRLLEESLQPDYPALTHLSMGMSDDLEAAIAEGSTWLRIGTAIFGPRD